jgi:succinate-semialdehyde dehydrogenase/glutarate-semialdehyde dehydrogenase
VLVFDDADVEPAARYLARTKTRNAGQVCMAPSRFYVHEKAYSRFLDAFAGVYASLRVGDGFAQDTQMGPLAHERRVESMQSLVADARARGAAVVCGGERLQRDGYFFPPTIVTDVPDDARVMTEEPFGPLVPVTRFKTTDEAIARANALPYGLASYAFTNSLATATEVSNRLEAGMVSINHFGLALAETPLGGVKDSGMGSEGGTETFDGYLVTKFISQASQVP